MGILQFFKALEAEFNFHFPYAAEYDDYDSQSFESWLSQCLGGRTLDEINSQFYGNACDAFEYLNSHG